MCVHALLSIPYYSIRLLHKTDKPSDTDISTTTKCVVRTKSPQNQVRSIIIICTFGNVQFYLHRPIADESQTVDSFPLSALSRCYCSPSPSPYLLLCFSLYALPDFHVTHHVTISTSIQSTECQSTPFKIELISKSKRNFDTIRPVRVI